MKWKARFGSGSASPHQSQRRGSKLSHGGRSQKEDERVCRPTVRDSHHFDEEPDPDLVKSRIRISINVNRDIRIRIKMMQIRNPEGQHSAEIFKFWTSIRYAIKYTPLPLMGSVQMLMNIYWVFQKYRPRKSDKVCDEKLPHPPSLRNNEVKNQYRTHLLKITQYQPLQKYSTHGKFYNGWRLESGETCEEEVESWCLLNGAGLPEGPGPHRIKERPSRGIGRRSICRATPES